MSRIRGSGIAELEFRGTGVSFAEKALLVIFGLECSAAEYFALTTKESVLKMLANADEQGFEKVSRLTRFIKRERDFCESTNDDEARRLMALVRSIFTTGISFIIAPAVAYQCMWALHPIWAAVLFLSRAPRTWEDVSGARIPPEDIPPAFWTGEDDALYMFRMFELVTKQETLAPSVLQERVGRLLRIERDISKDVREAAKALGVPLLEGNRGPKRKSESL